MLPLFLAIIAQFLLASGVVAYRDPSMNDALTMQVGRTHSPAWRASDRRGPLRLQIAGLTSSAREF
jgi:hypothetical protein